MNHRKQDQLERLERRAQREIRETAAGKLLAKVPELTSLSIAMHETRPAGCVGDTHYIRRIVIDSAPALFEVPCSEKDCEDGGYDVTYEVLAALTSRQTHFEGERSCRGRCGPVDCGRVLRFVGTAAYGPKVEPGKGARGVTSSL